jgi:hypothetical protein
MKTFLLTFLISFQSLACDWSTIERQDDKFIYSSKCHLSVGRLVKTEKKREEQVKTLNKSLELKDLALSESDKRADLWEKEANKQNELLRKSEKSAKLEKVIWFGAGVASVLFGAWAINKVK